MLWYSYALLINQGNYVRGTEADPTAKCLVKFALAEMPDLDLATFTEILYEKPENPRERC